MAGASRRQGRLLISLYRRVGRGGDRRGMFDRSAALLPEQPVTRAQMSTFLARVLDLLPQPEPPTAGDGTADTSEYSIGYVVLIGHRYTQWVARADGSDRTKLADDTLWLGEWSPDNPYIAYHVGTHTGTELELELWVVDRDGSDFNPARTEAIQLAPYRLGI